MIARSLLFLLKFYVTTVCVFLVAKLAFILSLAPATPLADMVQVLRHGLSLDLSTALYFLVVPLTAVVVSQWAAPAGGMVARAVTSVMRAYRLLLAIAFALAFVADTSLYAFWDFKLDASCLQYLSQPGGITASVSAAYLLVRLLLTAITAAAIFALYAWPAALREPPTPPTEETRGQRIRRGARATLLITALTPLMVIGIRGGLSESTTNIGQVYFSERQFLNHAAVNPVFSFLYSLSHQVGDVSQYQFMTDDEAHTLTEGVYTTGSITTDTLLATTTPSIVIIIMESAGEQFATAMPRLQQLKGEGVYFAACYANSWRTDRGTLSLLSGYPSFPTLSVMKMPHKSRTLPSIAATLRTRGYTTHYLYGGDINFTNMRSYLLSTGWQTLTSMDDYPPQEQASAKWGVRDDITFATLRSLISSSTATAHGSTATRQPFLIGYSTLSSHEPWDVPLSRHQDPVRNAFAYLDDCLADFIDAMKATPQWHDLLVIVTADHGIIHDGVDNSTPQQKNHIPMLWLGGAVRQPRIVHTLCNQSDLAATLLAQLRTGHDDFTFSRDVLSATYTHPTAVNNYNNAQWLLDASGQTLYDLDAHKVTLTNTDTTATTSLLRLSQAMLQLTTTDLSKR